MNPDSAIPSLIVGREGAVATIAFNRPQALNAIDVPMAQGFLAAVKAIAADPGVRAVLMRGEGKASWPAATWRCWAPTRRAARPR